MGLSDFPCSFIIVFCPWTSRCVPKTLAFGRTRDLSTSVQDVSLRARVTETAQDSDPACDGAGPDVAFRVVSGRRRPEVRGISRLNNLAHSSSCLRFVSGLTTVPARLGAGVAG